MRLMDFTESETQAPDDFSNLETNYNTPPVLAQECKSFKWKVQVIDGIGMIEDQMLTITLIKTPVNLMKILEAYLDHGWVN
uniref:Uncharacterized protein n=1 Tax=Noccaea caerulescens TaxID=107243 RepID=A0A1J3CIL9_NOCCA